MNGFNLLAANEVDKNIMLTNKFNHSKYTDESHFILGDVTLEETKQRIIDACNGNPVDVVVGGPPCQGFSYAGWRDPNDKRNQLFRDFVELVCRIRPRFFVMENVLGILTMRKGDAIKEIIEAFEEIGYHVNTPFKLNAANFGVPQKRKRVIIIGSLDHTISLTPPKPLFDDNSIALPQFVSVRDAIGNLPQIDDGGGEIEMDFEFAKKSLYDMLMQKEIDFEQFYKLTCEQSKS